MITVYHVVVRVTGQINQTFDFGVWASESQAASTAQAVVDLLAPFAAQHSIMFDVLTTPRIVNDLCYAVDTLGALQTELGRII